MEGRGEEEWVAWIVSNRLVVLVCGRRAFGMRRRMGSRGIGSGPDGVGTCRYAYQGQHADRPLESHLECSPCCPAVDWCSYSYVSGVGKGGLPWLNVR